MATVERPAAATKGEAVAVEGERRDDDVDDVFYDEMDLVEMEFDEAGDKFTAPCPCGDKFFITVDQLFDNEEKATCPSCSLLLKVVYDPDDVRRQFEEEAEVVDEV